MMRHSLAGRIARTGKIHSRQEQMKNRLNRRHPQRPPVFARTILAMLLAGATGAQAQIWSGGGLTNNWSDAFNWTGFVLPGSSPTTLITFSASTRLAPIQNLVNPFQVNTLTFASGAGAYSISGFPLRFAGATSNLIQNSASAITIGNGIQIDGNLVYSGAGSATLTGVVSRSGVNSAANTSITKTGSGTLTLSNANTFDGMVAINQGQIRLGQGLALQNGTVAIGVNNGLNLNGLASATLGNLSGTGSLGLGATQLTIGKNNQSPAAYSGTITGSTGSLTKVGTGTTSLSGAGSSFDNLLVQEGKLTLSGGSMTLTNTQEGLKVGTGVAGASGGPILELINGASVSALGRTVQVDGAGGTRLDILGTGSRLSTGFQTLVGNHATGSLNVSSGGTMQAGTFLAFGFNDGSVGTLNVSAGGSVTSTFGLLGTLTGAVGTADVAGAEASWLTAGLGLGGFDNSLRGGTGTLTVRNGGRVRVSDELTLWTAGSSIAVNGGSLVTGRLTSNGSLVTIDLVADPVGGAALTIDSLVGSHTYAGAISGDGSLLKTGGSTQSLLGANTFTGAVTVRGGTLEMSSGAASFYEVGAGSTLRLGARTLGFGVVQADPGSAVIYTNTTVNGGTLIGSGTHDIAAVNRMVGANVGNGVALTPTNGASFVGVVNGGDITNAAGRSFAWTGGSNTVGTVKVAGTTTVSGWSSGGVIDVDNGGTLVNTGSNLVLAGGSRTYVGSVDAPGGAIILQNGTRMQLNGALLVNNGIIAGPVDVNFGSLAKGAGLYGTVNVTDGGKFSPGNSPGNTVSGDVTWGAGGTYLVEFAAAIGTAGTHWDLWTINGTLNITAGTTANSRFTISLTTLNDADQPALLAGFDHRQAYRWQIVDTTGGVIGFDAAKLGLDTGGFLNTLGGGKLQLALSDGDVFVDFVPAPIPEPHEWMLMLVGLGCVASMARRQRKHTAQTA